MNRLWHHLAERATRSAHAGEDGGAGACLDCGEDLDEITGACACAIDAVGGARTAARSPAPVGGMRAMAARRYRERTPGEAALALLNHSDKLQLVALAEGRTIKQRIASRLAANGLVLLAEQLPARLSPLGEAAAAVQTSRMRCRKEVATSVRDGE